MVADDVVSFGTVNLDAWALYRNSEIMMIARSPEAAALMRERLFEPDIARSQPGAPADGTRERLAVRAVRQARLLPLSACASPCSRRGALAAGCGGDDGDGSAARRCRARPRRCA